MQIKHTPLFDIPFLEKHYSGKDGVPVKYVCTSATNLNSTFAVDIYYRASPHSEYGSHYFGLYRTPYAGGATITITDVDCIESLTFGMIECDGKYHYSQHRNDCNKINGKMIDGGRACIRSGEHDVYVFKIQDGEFVHSK